MQPPGPVATPGPAHIPGPGLAWPGLPAPGLPAPPAGVAAPGGPWRLQRSPNPVVHNGMLVADSCTGPGACVAVGGYENTVGTQVTLAQARTGTGWRIQPTPVPAGALLSNLFGVSCTAPGACTAAGYYVNADRQIRPLVDRWNGKAWSIQVAPSPAGRPEAGFFAVSCPAANACTAVGAQTDSAGSTTPLAERWNGTAWRIQPVSASAGSLASELLAVSCPTAAACSAAGSQVNSAQKPVPLAEGWNGTKWAIQPVPSPAGAAGAGFSGLSCSSPSACTAAGSYGDSSGTTALLAEGWNGIRWAIQATPAPAGSTGSEFLAVSCSALAACTAAGATTIAAAASGAGRSGGSGSSITVSLAERWNGTSWRVQATPSPAGASVSSGLAGVSCTSPRACTAAGFSTGTTGDSTTLAERWDGSQRTLALAERWSGGHWALQQFPLPPGTAQGSHLSGVSCPAANRCFASGWYFTASGAAAFAASWDGTRWRVQPMPGPAGSGDLFGVSCSSPAACVAVGSKGTEVWNGTRWRYAALAKPAGSQAPALNGVSCTSASFCTAVGEYFSLNAGPLTLAETWNGTAWRIQASPNPIPGGRNEPSTVSCTSPRDCIAVGVDAESDFAPPGAFAESWDGSRWRLQPVPAPAGAVLTRLSGVSCPAPAAWTAVGDVGGLSGVLVTMAMTTAGG